MKARLEKVLASGPIHAWRYETAAFHAAYHFHPEAEITLIEAGSGRRLVGEALSEFAPGDLVFLAGNLPHSYHSHPDLELRGPTGRASVVQFRWEALLDWGAWGLELHHWLRLHEAARAGLVFGPATRERLLPFFEQCVTEKGVMQLRALLAMLEVLAQAPERAAISSSLALLEPDLAHVERLEKVTAYIFTHFREPITLEEAAERAHLTPAAFSRFFRRHTHRTFVRFVNELRVGYAARLLLETDRTVADVAFDSGFRNLANFNRRFRELRQCSPSDFRRRAVPPQS